MKKLQMLSGLGCILLASFTHAAPLSSKEVDVSAEKCTLEKCIQSPSKPVNLPFWMMLYGIFTLFAGISGKLITSSCLKHGEIIKKIRI
jgi:hypothetical protein